MFAHEKLDVYRLSIDFVAWSYVLSKNLTGINRPAREQLLRASQSIPLNIAEGNGRRSRADRTRFLSIAYGSALECAAILDVLRACQAIAEQEAAHGKRMLDRIVAMLIRMTSRVDRIQEEALPYGDDPFECEDECERECD